MQFMYQQLSTNGKNIVQNSLIMRDRKFKKVTSTLMCFQLIELSTKYDFNWYTYPKIILKCI